MKRILVPIDFNPLSTAAMEYAALLATASQATLIVIYADTFAPPVEFTAEQTATLAETIRESRRKTTEELERYAHEHIPETLDVRTEVRESLAVEGILAAIDEHQPDLLVMGTHGRGALSRMMYGSATEAVLRETNVPVLTIQSIGPFALPREMVCVGTNGGASFASAFGTTCRIVPALAADLDADLIVIDKALRASARHARVPVLHIAA